MKELEDSTSAAEDTKLLEEKDLDPRLRFCIIYRLERKKILQSQLHLCNLLIRFLDTIKKTKDDYMEPSNFEFDVEGNKEAYFLRRLRCRHYLRQVTDLFMDD